MDQTIGGGGGKAAGQLSPEAANDVRLIYVTTADRAQAAEIGRRLVEEKLCACVNIIDGMHSIYEWQGGVEAVQEAVLLCKTDLAREAAVYERIGALHPYQVPCILSLPVTAGHPQYLSWLRG